MEGDNIKLIFALGAIFYLVLVWIHRTDPFFWDTIQFAGKHGLWYYEKGLSAGFLPADLNSGHPPTFGIYQSLLWKMFGKNLTVSHFSLLPFLLLNLYYSLRLGHLILGQRYWLFLLAFMLCPFYLGHSVLVSPDLILVTGFLMTLYGILKKHRTTIFLGGLLLALISIRGQMMLGVLMVYYLLLNFDKVSFAKNIKATLSQFGFGLALTIFFHLAQSLSTDWEGLEASPWAASFEYVSFKGWIRQLGIFGWRLVDYGMLISTAIVLLGISKLWKDKYRLLLLAILIGLALVLVLTPRAGLMNHRYFLPLIIIILLMAAQVVGEYWSTWKGKAMAILIIVALLLGNRLIYPDAVAQGWDSTAAHWPTYKLENKMYTYILDQGLKPEDIGTAFPYRSARSFSTLGEEVGGYRQFDTTRDAYILYGNIMNEFSDEDLRRLEQDYERVKGLERSGLHLGLYKRK